MKRIQLSDHFTIPKILLFALPSIGMQLVDNTYQIADGYFISNYISEAAFEAENLIFPPLLIVMSVGLMFGTGGSALIAKELGEGRKEKANRLLSMIIAVLVVVGVLLSVALYLLVPSVARWVGASEAMIPGCVTYGRVLAFFMPFQMLSMALHPLLITAERPGLGLITTISNAVANILLDWAFVAGFGWGMRGAAIATGLAWLVSAVIPLVYFFNPKHSMHFVRFSGELSALGQCLYNGASEMVDAISYAAVALIFNLRLLHFLGDDGVGAYAVSEYVTGLFIAIFYGISMSIVPVVGYHLGNRNVKELKSLRRNGLMLTGGFGVLMAAMSYLLAEPISRIFVGYNPELTALSTHALKIISLYCLLTGVTTYSSSYFTGLNQGGSSLAIALMKGFIGPLAMVFLLPAIIGAEGIWYASPAAEILTLLVALVCFHLWKKREETGDLPEPDESA